jgi:phosphoribosylaminoimidazole carboxylase (NCAIR synthetase)
MEGAVVANLRAKEAKYEAMAEAMVEHMRDLSTAAVRGGRVSTSTYSPTQTMEVPTWLTAA